MANRIKGITVEIDGDTTIATHKICTNEKRVIK